MEKDIHPSGKQNIIAEAAAEQNREEIFNHDRDLLETANSAGELQESFGEGWSKLKAIPAGDEMKALQILYEEAKANFKKLETASE